MYEYVRKLTVSAKARTCQSKPLSWVFRTERSCIFNTQIEECLQKLKSIYSSIKESEEEILQEQNKPRKNEIH